MIISKLEANILWLPHRDNGIELLKHIEYIARVSHRTEDRITEDSYDKFLRSIVMTHGDLSVIEHQIVTVECELDRGISHEWVRHRIGAYTQESTRFVNYGKQGGVRFIEPPFTRKDYEGVEEAKLDKTILGWYAFIEFSENLYLEMLENGQSPQLARSVLPTCTATKLVVTYNLRAWRHFFIMRTCKEAHPQMKEVTLPLLEQFKERIPILYEDIEPNMRQADAMRLLR